MPESNMPESNMPESNMPESRVKHYRAEVRVVLKRSILDPQGRAVENTLKRLGHDNIADLRVGKVVVLTLTGERGEVERQLRDMAGKVLSNPVMEDATFTLTEITSGRPRP